MPLVKGKLYRGWYLSGVFEQFLNHISKHRLIQEKDRILLALSGGKDSTVMLDLCRRAGFSIGIAHCNFGLRGADSDMDAEFVRGMAVQDAIPYHEKNFEPLRYAEEKGISMQMAARELRYAWFNELLQQQGYSLIATAHHLNDSLETVLLNLSRGTGMDGLTGIAVRQHKTIRPLLFASRSQIDRYAEEQGLRWRDDASNATEDYQRNRIRHSVIPVLREINPGLEETFRSTVARVSAARDVVHHFLKDFSLRNITYDGKHIYIRKEEILRLASGAEILWELLKDLGFRLDQCVSIYEQSDRTGATFTSGTHQLTIDRKTFMIGKISRKAGIAIDIIEGTTEVVADKYALSFSLVDGEGIEPESDPGVAYLDADALQFPMLWRDWQEGDRFIPLGMKTKKKVSDFLIDQKISRPMKDRVTVLTSGGEIVWVVGMRIADPYKVTQNSRRVWVIRGEETD